GLADPRALTLTLAAKDAYHFLGSPEGELALAEAVVYLATAPKSNRVYAAFARAMEAATAHPAEAVPLHIRNAPTKLMEELGYCASASARVCDDARSHKPGSCGSGGHLTARKSPWAQTAIVEASRCSPRARSRTWRSAATTCARWRTPPVGASGRDARASSCTP